MLVFGIFNNNNHLFQLYLGLIFVYFVLTVIFIFVTFGYVNELEKENCECAGEIGPDVLQIFAWVRILSFILALFAVVMLLHGQNKFVTVTKKTPKIKLGTTKQKS